MLTSNQRRADGSVARRLSRRGFIGAAGGLVLAMPLLAACGGSAAPSPTGAPATGGAAKPSVGGQTGTTAGGQASTPAAAAQASGAQIPLSIATYAGSIGDWERHFVDGWIKKNPNVKVTVDVIPYADMPKKQLLQIAAGDMEDVTFSGIKWYRYTIFKGGFRPIDDYVKSADPGMEDFFPSSIDNSKFEGKLYGLPYHFDPGNLAIAYFNHSLFEAKGVPVPTDDWKYQDVADLGQKLTDPAKKVWGVAYTPSTFYDFASLCRTWGTDVFSPDSKKLLLNTDPKAVEAAQWITDLHVKHKVSANREESQGQSFAAGQVAINFGSNNFVSNDKQIGDKFKWSVAMFPKGPDGKRGYHSFNEMWSIYSKTKQPEKAYDLMTALVTKEAFVYKATEGVNDPGCRKSAWSDPAVLKVNPAIDRLLAWINSTDGTFPVPDNLRFSELQDKWQNTTLPIFYGEVPFADGMKRAQSECQAIMDQPRG